MTSWTGLLFGVERRLCAVVVAGRVQSTFIRPTPVRRQVRSASSRVAGPPSHHIITTISTSSTSSSSRQPASRQTPPPSTAATSSRPHPVQPYTPTRLATPNRRSLTIHPPTATRCIGGFGEDALYQLSLYTGHHSESIIDSSAHSAWRSVATAVEVIQ